MTIRIRTCTIHLSVCVRACVFVCVCVGGVRVGVGCVFLVDGRMCGYSNMCKEPDPDGTIPLRPWTLPLDSRVVCLYISRTHVL